MSHALSSAMKIAGHLLGMLGPGCERIEIAGSVRRRKSAEIKDLDIVCIPSAVGQFNLFGGLVGARCGAWLILEGLRREGRMIPMRPTGEHYAEDEMERMWTPRQWHQADKSSLLTLWLTKPQMRVELHRIAPEQWGAAMLVRTGHADFSKWFVSEVLPQREMTMRGYRLWRGELPLHTPEERDVFDAAGIEYVEPIARRQYYRPKSAN